MHVGTRPPVILQSRGIRPRMAGRAVADGSLGMPFLGFISGPVAAGALRSICVYAMSRLYLRTCFDYSLRPWRIRCDVHPGAWVHQRRRSGHARDRTRIRPGRGHGHPRVYPQPGDTRDRVNPGPGTPAESSGQNSGVCGTILYAIPTNGAAQTPIIDDVRWAREHCV